ncbi:hypothetical protein [Mahella australiensis]|uniref:Uncharacterized protein n=1 Tax=Mahella australiensis (strain DSM 15567 / CIP 107919 / 50-1 BON) TaxID=697281 RepID=F3ZX58_MAHA5|nr:hypothetical protein [Mahella australiensis]AEE95507.1 hypothetical protein Mahau_0290 [Mahella australiensis 50-1 BON]
MALTYNITPAAFGWLGQAFADKNLISPFLAFEKNKGDFDEEGKAALVSQGIITDDGTVRPEAAAAFGVLANAEGFYRIQILGVESPVDKVTYYKGNATCSVDSSDGYFVVSFPAVSREAGFTMEEFTGSSRLIDVPFHESLSYNAALAFLSLLDLRRAANLCAMAGETRSAVFSADEIADRINKDQSLMWFVNSLKKLIDVDHLSAADVSGAIPELKGKGMIAENGNGFSLTGEAEELADFFLIPEYVFDIEYGKMISPSACEHSECRVIFCGMHRLLYIDTDGDKIVIETMSGSELFEIIWDALGNNIGKSSIPSPRLNVSR